MSRKTKALLLCFFLGGIGAHDFYMSRDACGFAKLALWIAGFFTAGITWMATGIWSFVDLFIIAFKDEDEI